MSCTLFEFTVGAEHDGLKLRDFLRRGCGITARSMTILKYYGNITRENEPLKAHDVVHEDDVITLSLPREKSDITPVEGVLDVLYENAFLLIVNKPFGMPVHPTKVHQTDTLANIVTWYQESRGESYVFRALNRLDKDTSGCVIIAKDRLTYSLVRDSIEKTYVAVCEGIIEDSGTINAPIGLADNSKIKRCVREDGAEAITHYRPITHSNGHTFLELRLETGRTHQIRCHMSHIGHPLAGDDLYGGSRELISRQALHCREVVLIHPFTGERLIITTAIPTEFSAIIKEGAH